MIQSGLYYKKLFWVSKSLVYIRERFVWQETFLSLKIRGLYSRAVSNRERVIMARIWYWIWMNPKFESKRSLLSLCLLRLCRPTLCLTELSLTRLCICRMRLCGINGVSSKPNVEYQVCPIKFKLWTVKLENKQVVRHKKNKNWGNYVFSRRFERYSFNQIRIHQDYLSEGKRNSSC